MKKRDLTNQQIIAAYNEGETKEELQEWMNVPLGEPQKAFQLETLVINFFACLSEENKKNNSELFQKYKVLFRKIIKETMKEYFDKRYITNIDYHYFPNQCGRDIINKIANESKKYL